MSDCFEKLGDSIVESINIRWAVSEAILSLLIKKGIVNNDEFEEEYVKQKSHIDEITEKTKTAKQP